MDMLEITSEEVSALLEDSKNIITVHDERGRITYVSQSVTDVLGYERDVGIGIDALEFVHPDDRETVLELFSELKTGVDGTSSRITFRIQRADESYAWLESVGTELSNTNRGSYVISSRDVTTFKRQERQLSRFATDLAALHDAANRLAVASSIDECHETVIDAAVNILGFDWCTVAVPNEATGTFEVKAVSDGSPLEVGEQGVSLEMSLAGEVFRTNDSVITADSRSSGRGDPTHDCIASSLTVPIGEYGVFQALATTTDAFDERDRQCADILIAPMANAISRIEQERELHRQKATLERQNDRIEALHSVAMEMKTLTTREEVYDVVIDAVEAILEFDTCILDEREGDVLVPKAVGSAVSADDYYDEVPIESPDNLGSKTFRDGRTYVVDDLHAAGFAPAQSKYTSALSVPLREWGIFQAASEQPDAFDGTDRRLIELLLEHAVTAIDRIDRERELERRAAQLERQNERLEEFAGLVSHDIRTPLSIATGYVPLVREEIDGDSEPLEEVATALTRIDELTDDMLALAREGHTAIDPVVVSVAELAQLRWHGMETGEATLVIADERTEDLTITADENRLGQVFENLFRNAIEHVGSDVTVRVQRLEDGFAVEDDGPGIPPEKRESVLERGYSGRTEGTGLGLAIVEEIAAAHGWEIAITDGNAGGARFEFRSVDVIE